MLAKRWRIVDVPNRRSLHDSPVPRGGGVAVAAATLVGLAVSQQWSTETVVLASSTCALAGVGLVDDVVGLPALPRLVAAAVVPALAAAVVLRGDTGVLADIVVAVVCVAGYVNAFNFMDGINGISSSQAVVAGSALAIVARHIDTESLVAGSAAICGASVGFLPFNAPRARIFLGDVGSYFMGAWLAGLALLVVDGGAPPLVVMGPFLLYILDTGTVLLKRAHRRVPLIQAHREHTYQRLVQLGWRHSAVAVLCALVSSACAGVMLSTLDRSIATQLLAFCGCLILVAIYLVLPSWIGARRSECTE